MAPERTRILIAGGGYAGMYTALRLQKKLRRELRAKTVEIVVVDPRSYMTYQPFLPEVAAGSIEARHAVVALRRHLKRTTVVAAKVTSIDHANRVATTTRVASRALRRSVVSPST
jgi:NADH dehydrogenase